MAAYPGCPGGPGAAFDRSSSMLGAVWLWFGRSTTFGFVFLRLLMFRSSLLLNTRFLSYWLTLYLLGGGVAMRFEENLE